MTQNQDLQSGMCFILSAQESLPVAALDKVGCSNELCRNGVTTKLVVTPA